MPKPRDVIILSNQGPEIPEIFYSLQGEGPEVGRPSIFIRLSGCNLYCRWCDTPYTWNWQGTRYTHDSGMKYKKSEEQVTLDIPQVLEAVAQFPSKNIVITGGEPLAQQGALLMLVNSLQALGEYVIDLETNATIQPSDLLDSQLSKYVCSPKLANASVPEKLRIKQQAVSWFARSSKAYFKFVVSTLDDFNEVNGLVKQFLIDPDKVYIMVEAIDENQIENLQRVVTGRCLELGYRYSDRLHIRLFGDKRGV